MAREGRILGGLALAVGLGTLVVLGAAVPARAQGTFPSVLNGIFADCSAAFSDLQFLGPQLTTFCGSTSVTVATPGTVTGLTEAIGAEDIARIFRRLEDKRRMVRPRPSAASADPGVSGRGLQLFGNADHEYTDKDVTRFEPGHTSHRWGGSIGLDYTWSSSLVTGAAFAGHHTDGDFAGSGGSFDAGHYGLLLYGSLMPASNLFIDLAAGYARKDYSLDRRFSATLGPITSGRISGDTDGNEYTAGLNAGYDFVVGGLTIGPRLGISYRRTEVDGFAESGTTGLELRYRDQVDDSLTSSLGAFASMAVSTGFGVLVPQASFAWVHEFLDDQRSIRFTFVQDAANTPFSFRNDPPDRDYFTADLGLALVLPGGLSPFVNYRALVGYDDRARHAVTFGIRLGF